MRIVKEITAVFNSVNKGAAFLYCCNAAFVSLYSGVPLVDALSPSKSVLDFSQGGGLTPYDWKVLFASFILKRINGSLSI